VSQPDADVKNSDTLWRYRKKFRFLKEAKFLSEFLHSKLACLMPICVSGRRTPDFAWRLKQKKFRTRTKTWGGGRERLGKYGIFFVCDVVFEDLPVVEGEGDLVDIVQFDDF
jgi:hypothetical protein